LDRLRLHRLGRRRRCLLWLLPAGRSVTPLVGWRLRRHPLGLGHLGRRLLLTIRPALLPIIDVRLRLRLHRLRLLPTTTLLLVDGRLHNWWWLHWRRLDRLRRCRLRLRKLPSGRPFLPVVPLRLHWLGLGCLRLGCLRLLLTSLLPVVYLRLHSLGLSLGLWYLGLRLLPSILLPSIPSARTTGLVNRILGLPCLWSGTHRRLNPPQSGRIDHADLRTRGLRILACPLDRRRRKRPTRILSQRRLLPLKRNGGRRRRSARNDCTTDRIRGRTGCSGGRAGLRTKDAFSLRRDRRRGHHLN
jgi:hypothetical protein